MAGQLGVPDLVSPVSQIAGLFDASQEVCEAQPTSVEQHDLVNDIHTGSHRIQRFPPSLSEAFAPGRVAVEFQLHCTKLVGEQRFQESFFVKLTILGMRSSTGPVRSGLSRWPDSAPLSRLVRCSHSRIPTRSVAE